MFKMIAAYFRRRHEKHYKNSTFHLVADIILALIVILLGAVLFFFLRYKPLPAVTVNISSANDKIFSGRLENFEISYHANEKTKDSSLAIMFPDNFILEKVEPADIFDKNTNTFKLGDLSRGSNGRIIIQGTARGELYSHQALAYDLSCSNCGNGLLNSFLYNIEGSTINAELSIPKEVYKDVNFNTHVTVSNNGEQEEKDLLLDISGPWDWSKNDFINNGEWKIDSLKPGEFREFDLMLLPKEEGDNKEISLNIFEELNGQRVKQTIVTNTTSVKVPEIAFTIMPKKNIAKDGEDIVYQIFAENRGQNKISNLRVSLESENKNFSLDKIIPADKDTVISDKTLVFKDTNPGARISAAFKASFKRQNIAVNQSLNLKMTASYESSGRTFSYELISPAVKLSSNTLIKSRAYYYSAQGDQLGLGPIPPMVDMATNYWIFWEVNNLGNALDNFTIAGDLPEDVIWTDNTNVLGGKLMHGQVGGRVIWQAGNIVADPADYKGEQQHIYKAGFEVGIIPSSADLGKVITLLKNAKYSARDSFTGEEISGWLKDLDTNIENDRLGAGKGLVVENQ